MQQNQRTEVICLVGILADVEDAPTLLSISIKTIRFNTTSIIYNTKFINFNTTGHHGIIVAAVQCVVAAPVRDAVGTVGIVRALRCGRGIKQPRYCKQHVIYENKKNGG